MIEFPLTDRVLCPYLEMGRLASLHNAFYSATSTIHTNNYQPMTGIVVPHRSALYVSANFPVISLAQNYCRKPPLLDKNQAMVFGLSHQEKAADTTPSGGLDV
jgi:hypothetical protein